MPNGRAWTKREEQALLQGVGVYGFGWFRCRTGDSYDWPNAPIGRSSDAVKAKCRRMYGGGLTRGSYTLREVCRITGYAMTHVRRACVALAQKWKRTSLKGSFLISEEQMEDIVYWLRKDYWSKKHRLYTCLWCGQEEQPHYSNGLCQRCFEKYRKRLKRSGLPVQTKKLLAYVRKLGGMEEAEKALLRGRAVSQEVLILLIRGQYCV